MLEALKEIGEVLVKQGVEFPIEEVGIRRGVKEPLLAKIIFDLNSGELDCDCYIKCDEGKAKEFLWVGNARGQKPQLRLTTNNPEYLLNPSNKPNKWAIGAILKEVESEELYKDPNIKELYELLSKIKEKFFGEGEKKSLLPEFDELLRKKECSPRNIVLYTVSVKCGDSVIDLVKTPGYRNFLHYVLYESGHKERGKCHVCGREEEVLTEPSYPEGTILCIYNIDKAGFMSDLSRKPQNLLRTHSVCPSCKKKLVLGLNYVERNLSSNIGELTIYLIPRIAGVELTSNELNIISYGIRNAFNIAKALKSLEEVEDSLETLREMKGREGLYFLDILFGSAEGSHFAYQYYIQDVPVMRLIELAEVFSEFSSKVAGMFLEEVGRWSIGFEDIYRIFPLRPTEWKPIVELYNSMLTGTKYPRETIISEAVLFTRINRYGIEGYNIEPLKDGEEELCRSILKFSMLLKLGMQMGIVESGEERKPDLSELPDHIERFVLEMGYTEWQTALFLIGVLVGEIGVEQYKKGDEKKSVLNKINFDGMSSERVKILANYLPEGLRNYRILNSYTESIYASMKKMLDRNIEKLKNPVDNVFYILSGYAYITLRHILGGE